MATHARRRSILPRRHRQETNLFSYSWAGTSPTPQACYIDGKAWTATSASSRSARRGHAGRARLIDLSLGATRTLGPSGNLPENEGDGLRWR